MSRRIISKNINDNFYNQSRRTKKAWACQHTNKLHYSKGLCQNCYLANYYRERKAKNGKSQSLPEPSLDSQSQQLVEP